MRLPDYFPFSVEGVNDAGFLSSRIWIGQKPSFPIGSEPTETLRQSRLLLSLHEHQQTGRDRRLVRLPHGCSYYLAVFRKHQEQCLECRQCNETHIPARRNHSVPQTFYPTGIECVGASRQYPVQSLACSLSLSPKNVQTRRLAEQCL